MNNLSQRENLFREIVNTSAAIMQPEVSFPEGMLKQFYEYWSEPNKSGTKMRWEMEKTWDTGRRLKRWFDNQKKWNNGTTGNNKAGTSAARIETARKW